MPNAYIKPEKRVALALALLHQRAKLVGLVTPFDGRGFIGARNYTLYYKTKGITKARDYEFRTRTNPIVFDEIYRNELPITLDQHMTQGVKWTDEEELLDLTSYRDEILVPQVEAMAERFDSKIENLLTSYSNFKTTSASIVATGDANGDGAHRQLLKLKALADADGVPSSGRVLVAGANLFVWLAASKALLAYDPPQARTMFHTGISGSMAGMLIFDGTGIVGENDFVLVHKSWAVLANAAPVVPDGVAWGARMQYEGMSLRVIKDYDSNYLSDRSVLNTFWGLSPIADEYARHTSNGAVGTGIEKGDIIIKDGKPKFTGKNVRGLKGTFTPAA